MENKKNIENLDEETYLSSLNKDNNFSVPENYFDYLPQEIMNKIHSGLKLKKAYILNPSVIFSSLAVFAGVIFFIFFSLNKKSVSSDKNILSDNEVNAIIENYDFYNINENLITETYLNTTSSDEIQNADAGLSNEEIKNYLEANTNEDTIVDNL